MLCRGWVSGKNPPKGTAFSNGVVELSDKNLLLAGVVVDQTGAYRILIKLSHESGKPVWSTPLNAFGDSKGSSGAWEMVDITKSNPTAASAVILSGFDQLDCGNRCAEELAFKSGGITYGGKAVAIKLPEAAFLSEAAPTRTQIQALLSADKSWSVPVHGYETVRSARFTPDKKGADSVVLLLRNQDLNTVAIQKVTSEGGSVIWDTGVLNATIGQGTAITISDDGNIAMTGLSQTKGRWAESTITVGRLSLFDGQTGNLLWTRSFSVGGVPELIRHECWGVVAIGQKGYATICGTGIEPEQCQNKHLPSAVRENCTKGIGDNRPGAVPRAPDIWQSMVVMSDQQGKLLWQRVDSYRPPHSHAPLGASGGSAAEWGTITNEDGLLICLDDPAAGSLGLMQLTPKGSH